jgi:hypothetical protein
MKIQIAPLSRVAILLTVTFAFSLAEPSSYARNGADDGATPEATEHVDATAHEATEHASTTSSATSTDKSSSSKKSGSKRKTHSSHHSSKHK